MPLRQSEAIVLRTYPLKESDRIVSFFAREYGKCRGVSRGARRIKSRFGAALEPLSQVRISFFERENRELATIDHCELIASLMTAPADDFSAAVGRAYIAEVADRMLPDREVNDRVFRLLSLVVNAVRQNLPLWLVLTYYAYWMVRLGGFLPDLGACAACKRPFEANGTAYFHVAREGLYCPACRPASAQALSAASRALAQAISRTPLDRLASTDWQSNLYAADLRRLLNSALEQHLETRLQSWAMLVSATANG